MPTRYLQNANITHVSYVDKAANKKQFFLTKSDKGDDQTEITKQVKLLKGEDEEQKLVYGVVYEPDTPDSQNDAMTPQEIEKAAHKFMSDYRQIDKQHDWQGGQGEVVESYVAPADFEVNGETITKGSWVITTKATEEVWESIKKGEITGYSMGGLAEVVEKADEPKDEPDSNTVNKIAKALTNLVTKGELKDNFDKQNKKRSFRTAFDMFESLWFQELWKDNPDDMDVEKMRENANDFIDVLQSIVNQPNLVKALGGMEGIKKLREDRDLQPVTKAGKKISAARLKKLKAAQTAISEIVEEAEGDEEVMKAEELQEAVTKAMQPFNDRLDAIEKAQKGEDTEQGDDKGQTVEKEDKGEQLTAETITKAVEEALKPIEKRVSEMENSRQVKKSADTSDETPTDEPADSDNFWSGVL